MKLLLSRIVVTLIAVACSFATHVYAQSSPNLTYGQVPTAAQWNLFFSSKQDSLGFRPVNSAGDTMTGKLKFAPAISSAASLNIATGINPSSPNNGDMWFTASGLYFRINNITETFLFQNFTNFSAFFANWMASLPTTLPGTAGEAWNDGGIPASATGYPSPIFQDLDVRGVAKLPGTGYSYAHTGEAITYSATIPFTDLSGQATLAQLPTIAADTYLGNAGALSAVPSAVARSNCNGATKALNYTPGSGETCNSAIAAATVTTNANLTGDVTSVGNATTIANNAVTNAKAAQMAANTVKANATNTTANAADFAMPSCSTSSCALQWTTNTGFKSNSAINAATLGGATFAAPGPIGGTTPGTGSFSYLEANSAFRQRGVTTADNNIVGVDSETLDNSTDDTKAHYGGLFIHTSNPPTGGPYATAHEAVIGLQYFNTAGTYAYGFGVGGTAFSCYTALVLCSTANVNVAYLAGVYGSAQAGGVGTVTDLIGLWADGATNIIEVGATATRSEGILITSPTHTSGSTRLFGIYFKGNQPLSGSIASEAGKAINIAPGSHVNIQNNSGSTISVGSCGTGAHVVGNDNVMKIDVGTGATTSCTVNLNNTWTEANPICTAGRSTLLTADATVSGSTLTVKSGANFIATESISVICLGWLGQQ